MQNESEFADHLRTTPYDDFAPLMEAMFPGSGDKLLALYHEIDELQHGSALVYFMRRSSDGAVKIGYTKTLNNRRRMIERVSECEVEVLATRRGGAMLERLYHSRFDCFCIGLEWFDPAPAILAEIARLNQFGPEQRWP